MSDQPINIHGTADDLLDWQQHVGAQTWRNKDGTWTCFVRGLNGDAHQPTRPTLREALIVAKEIFP